jgi:PAS domain S-box-containing protein
MIRVTVSGTDLLNALAVAAYTTDAGGFITQYNEEAANLWGARPEPGRAQWYGAARLLWPDGTPMEREDSPLAKSFRTGEAVRGLEAIVERSDGSQTPVAFYPTLLRDGAGTITGAINLMIDQGERGRTDIEAARLAALVSSSDDAIVSKTLDGIVTSWNAGATRIFGYSPEEMIGQSITRLIPPELQDEEADILAKLRRGERVEHFDTVRVTKDGRRLDISLTISPIRDRSGRILGASKVARDITERKAGEALQRLLFDELNHRVKNTLATVQAIANQSLRRSSRPEEFAASFSGRVQALARAHDLLVHARMRGAAVSDIIREQVLFGAGDPGRIEVAGPAVTLDAKSAVQLALVLHELSTNARKYGALHGDAGRLSITWKVEAHPAPQLFLSWQESGVRNLSAPESRGFGTTLIERSLDAQGGTARIEYGSQGLTCTIKLPLREPEETPWFNEERRADQPLHKLDRAELRGKRVLVVEDEPLVSIELETLLEEAGCEVVGPAGTKSAALQLIEAEEIDLAVLDVNIDGYPADAIAAAATRKGIPFLFATGYDQHGIPMAFTGTPVIKKPFEGDHLLDTLSQLIATGDDRDADVVKLYPR